MSSKNKNKLISTKKSYGILCTRFNIKTKKIEFLLVKKRCTFYYIEFIFKNHNRDDPQKLLFLFNHMTNDEKLDIMSLDFNKMWYRITLMNPDSPYIPDHLKLSPEKYERYMTCKNNFEKNFLVDKGRKLLNLIYKSHNSECLWEIPKGRKSFPQEKDLICAMREFKEETNISSNDYEILDSTPFITSNISSNVKYINHFYLAVMHGFSSLNKKRKPELNYANIHQISEVSDIGWFNIDQINILDTSGKLGQFIKTINKILRKKYKIQKLVELNLLRPINFELKNESR